ncbi:MAG: TonB-dependent receptor [candidate division Zixibacteria bacterium]|nr:TonB-dependent receptor [candidate division Zixibacteria bacterium]
MRTLSEFLPWLLVLILPATQSAPTGTLMGQLTEARTGNSLIGATIRVMSARDTTIVRGAFTDMKGNYNIPALSPGAYRVTVTSIGYEPVSIPSVVIASGDTLRRDIALEPQTIYGDAIIVSASRRQEKILNAPASVSVIESRQISERPSLAPSDHLRAIAGVDIAQSGLVQQSVVTRGFNNVASGSLTMLTDTRIASTPSLRVNIPYFTPLVDDDIDRIEVVRGPGSALYGPNASQGVVNIITRSPFASRGTSVSLTFGNQSLIQGAFRHASVFGTHMGYKISGQYFRGADWEFEDSTEVAQRAAAIAQGALEDTLRIAKRDPVIERLGGEARLDFVPSGNLGANVTFGLNQATRAIELTDIGAAQVKNWRYLYHRVRVNYGELFVQAYLNQSDAGETYLLRTGDRVVDKSKQIVAQAQHSSSFNEREQLTYGVDLFLTRPFTAGTINGRNEAKDNINEYGGYVQSETRVIRHAVDLVLTGRIDMHSQINDPAFSPRAALVYKPGENQNFRLTYNRAYSTPSTAQLFLDVLANADVFGFGADQAVQVRASGVPTTGFIFERDSNGRPFMHSTFSPDRSAAIPVDAAASLWPAVVQILGAQGKNISQIPAPTPADIRAVMGKLDLEAQAFNPAAGPADLSTLKPTLTRTIELGYKGVLSRKLQANIDLYYSQVANFIGPFQVITPSVFLNEADTKAYLQQQGLSEPEADSCAALIAQIPLGTVTPKEAADPTAIIVAPRNYGKVNLAGIDLSLEYQPNERFSLAGTYSHINKNLFKRLDGVADLALNAPRNKGSFTVKYRYAKLGLNVEVRNRWTEGFRMSSGVYVGSIRSTALFDVNIGYTIVKPKRTTLILSALNLLDKKHQEFIGAPKIGRLVLGKLAYTF